MGQDKRRGRRETINTTFPHHVDLVPPLDGFAVGTHQAIMQFLERRIGQFDMYGDCENGEMFIRYCFSSASDAIEFRDTFGSAAEKVSFKIAS